ncbi:putative EG45-like domain containing protein 1 [Solanum tuberosum]|uniref:putative EG45-like domain containing protein 1 n=1 Tax=Solanum tuberosum TaxID=4113 RepID=UPI00073A1B98|nr:PREDICTED: putative EG45-like domain containing protein 1 [Solanum tuberosum]
MKNRTKPKPKFEIQTFFTIRGKHSFLAISPKSERGKCESTVLTDFVVLEVLRVSIPRPQGRPCAATAAAATALFRGNVKETTKRSSGQNWVSTILIIGFVATLFSLALATPGNATFYTKYVPSACYGNKAQGTRIAAASDSLWGGGKICGKTFNVTCTGPTNPVPHPCTGKSIVVKIVDHCPGCGGTLDLSKEAFSTIANPVAGVININYVQ